MPSDAHAHPFDLLQRFSGAESERRRLGVRCAASSWNREEFLFQEDLSRRAAAEGGPAMVLCFGVHPQLPAADAEAAGAAWEALAALTAEGRIAAVGEAGFDLYDAAFRATEAVQDDLFTRQLDLAESASLPMVLHVRRAMHKVFAHSRRLAKLPAVVLHSYSGTLREAGDLLERGVNAYFSFGTTILLNHKQAMAACALLPEERLLFETDAPYQPLRGRPFSSWSDLAAVTAAAATLRSEAGSPVRSVEDLVQATDRNFAAAFGVETLSGDFR